MKILIIGGTKFLGRHLVKAARQNDHEVTLFNRGTKYADEKLAAVEQIHGDRNADLDKLSGRRWDACIDTCGYLPQTVKAAAEFLADKIEQYVFVSSGSVYAETAAPDYDETTRTKTLDEARRKEVEKIDPSGELSGVTLGENYGALKVLCEETAEAALPNRVLNVRAGMIVGAFDPTDRFTYWVTRVAAGGEVLAPGKPENYVQMIDARDLSEWIIKTIEENVTGTFNVTGKPFELDSGKMLDQIKTATESDAEFVRVDENFLAENNVAPWSGMPFYLPESAEETRGFLAMNVDKALANGLKFRPLRDTILDTLRWRETQNFAMRAGISEVREKELLEKWRDRK